MDFHTHHDIYCERIDPSFWAEPINALTNAAFFVAAFMAWRLAKAEGGVNWREGSLIAMVAIIGTGSFLFHTFATTWAKLTDVLPILFYQIIFLTVYAEKVMGVSARYKHLLLGAFLLTIYGFGHLPYDWFNGSLSYGPAFLFLTGLGTWHYVKSKERGSKIREPYVLLAASGVFLVSLTFRSIDMAVCEALPIGVHYFWHILNGVVLYLTTRAYILNKK